MKSPRFVLTAISAFAVVALLSGCGKSTSPTAVAPDNAPPGAPSQVDITVDPGTGMATLHWADNPGNSVTSYTVFAYSPSPDRDDSYYQIGETDASVTSLLIPISFQRGEQYFRVQAKNNSGNHSPFSYTVQVTLPGPTGGVDAPKGGGPGGRPRSS